MFSLFATLFVRLYYLQVVGGEEYHAQAASQSVREIVVQPQRGLIVDDMGRPLVANRTSWVVSVDRTHARQDAGDAAAAARRAPGRQVVDQRPRRGSASGWSPAATPAAWSAPAGTARRTSPCRSPPTCAQAMALRILEQPEDFPAVLAEQQSVRAYPRPYGINLAHVLGYLSPITEDGVRPGAARTATRRSTAPPSVGRAGVEKEYDRWLRGMPGYQRVAVDSMGRVLGDDGEVDGQPGRHPGHLDRRQGPGRRRAAARRRRSRPPGRPTTTVTHTNYVADSGAVVVMEAKTGRIVAMASQPTYDPSVWVGGITKKQLGAALLREGRHPAARPGDPGPVRARARRGSRS